MYMERERERDVYGERERDVYGERERCIWIERNIAYHQSLYIFLCFYLLEKSKILSLDDMKPF